MKKQKEYTIEISHTRRGDKQVKGTLEYLKDYFGYTLEVGHSWNPKIKKDPTTIKSLISNVQKAYEEKEAACYERTYVRLLEEAQLHG